MRWVIVSIVMAMMVPAFGQQDTNEIQELDVEQARDLATREGSLSLRGLPTLSPEVAEALARHKGLLLLDGLTTLSPEVAEALATHRGDLNLGSLTTLSVEAAKALAKHEGVLGIRESGQEQQRLVTSRSRRRRTPELPIATNPGDSTRVPKRMGWDLNPRTTFAVAGFQGRQSPSGHSRREHP
jgi:hypothetical protein